MSAERTPEEVQVELVAAIVALQEPAPLTVRDVQRDLRRLFGPAAVPCHIPIRHREEDA